MSRNGSWINSKKNSRTDIPPLKPSRRPLNSQQLHNRICNTISIALRLHKNRRAFFISQQGEKTMTIFSDNPHDRRIERFMTAIPNFKTRGVGVRFSESQILITVTAATPTEILTATMRQIRCPPFRKRFNEYIQSEEKPMTYINEKHRARFTLAARNVHRENYALLSALYLLTADQRLWSCCKHHINNGCVFFEIIKLHNCTERAYTLYCAAKDLTLGTKHLTMSDLSDADLVPPMLFRTICNAMAIRRFGLAAIRENCHD